MSNKSSNLERKNRYEILSMFSEIRYRIEIRVHVAIYHLQSLIDIGWIGVSIFLSYVVTCVMNGWLISNQFGLFKNGLFSGRAIYIA